MLLYSLFFLSIQPAVQAQAQSVEVPESKIQENLEEAPPVVFRVSASIRNSGLWGDSTAGILSPRVGNNFSYDLASNQGERNAASSGTVASQSTTGTVSGSFSTDVTGTNTINPFWRGISKRTTIEAFVRGSSATQFNLRLSITGNMLAQTSVQNAGGVNASINEITINSSNNPNTRGYENSVDIPFGNATSCNYTFPEYPNVTYCLARLTNIESGVLAVNGGSVRTNLFGRTNGDFQLTVTRLEPKISVEPVLIDFDAVRLTQSAMKSFIVRNTGTGTLNVNLNAISSPFRFVDGQRSFSILAGQSKTVEIEYRPTAIRMNKTDIVVSSNDSTSTPQVRAQGATAAKFKFWIKAFIPGNIPNYTIAVPSPPAPESNMTGIPDPRIFLATRVAYLTDQRSFSTSEQAKARITLIGEFEVQGYGRFVKTSQGLQQGLTIRCDLGIPGISSPFCLERTGKPRGGFGGTERFEETIFTSDFYFRGGNPFIPSLLNAFIDANGKIIVNFNAGHITLRGLIDKFPSFEMYMKIDSYNGTPPTTNLLQFNAIPPVTNILGAPDTSIDRNPIMF